MDDTVLLSRYVETGCQASFEQIVTRHSGWVFSLSLRAVRDRHMAEDVTQAVFIILARKARTIRAGTPLSGWLFKASRFAVSDALKRRTRMKNRENRFADFFKATAPFGGAAAAPGDGGPLLDDVSETLDEAVAFLSESDRQAVLLRFYEGKSLAEIGTIIGVSEEAAKKRVARAVERLRKYFAGRGVVAGIALILLLLSRRTAEAAGLSPIVVPAGAGAPTLAHAIAEGALQLMAHAQARLLGAIFAAAFALLVAIPTLGGAIAYIAGPPAVATAPAAAKPLPDVPSDTAQSPKRKLPEESRFADLWIAYKGELLWRSDAFTDPNPNPFILRSAEKQDRPYAVAVEPGGKFYIKPLDQAILQSPIIRQARFDYDAGPADPTRRVHEMLSIIDPPAHAPAAGAAASVATSGGDALKDLPEKHWHELKRTTEDDGTIVVEQTPMMRLQMLDQTGPSGFSPLDLVAEVPEPSAALVILGATALLTLRRRRRR